MDFGLIDLTPEQDAFRAQVRAFLDEAMTERVRAHELETGDGFDLELHLALGARGWLTPTWPVEEGGAGLDPVSCRILQLELQRYSAPMITAGTTIAVWRAIALSASPELRDELRPGVARGTLRFCLGYTEPDGGSDIANAKLKAVKDGDDWVLNGSKMFTTGAHNCHYCFLLARTDPTKAKHKGLTMFLVPLELPGIEIQGMRGLSGERTNIVYYDGVVLPDRFRLGEVDQGWSVLRGPLAAEHGAARAQPGLGDLSRGQEYLRSLVPALQAAVEWAATPGPDGRRPADDPTVLMRLGRVAADIEIGVCGVGPEGRIIGTEYLTRDAADLLDLVGPAALLSPGTPGALGDGAIDYAHRLAQGTATYGGTVEVFRNTIAQRVLRLPRPRYPGSSRYLPRGRRDAADEVDVRA